MLVEIFMEVCKTVFEIAFKFFEVQVIVFIAIMLTGYLNVLIEAIRQKKTPNAVTREWADRYLPRIEQKAREIKSFMFSFLD